MKRLLWILAIIITDSHCMLTNPRYRPYIQAKNPELTEYRLKAKFIKPFIKTNLPEDQQDPSFRCFQLTFYQMTEFKGFLNFPGPIGNSWQEPGTVDIGNYIDQTPHPRPGGCAIYTKNEIDHEMLHFAFIVDSVTFESKRGGNPYKDRHRLFDTLSSYGNTAYFYELKEQYRSVEGKQLLLRDIQKELDRNNTPVHCDLNKINSRGGCTIL